MPQKRSCVLDGYEVNYYRLVEKVEKPVSNQFLKALADRLCIDGDKSIKSNIRAAKNRGTR